MTPDLHTLYAVTEATWPAAQTHPVGPWIIRDGQGGGKRVSAATPTGPVSATDLPEAEAAMRALGQPALVMVPAGETALDDMLDRAGYAVVDPVNVYVCATGLLSAEPVPQLAVFDVWEPFAIQKDLWREAGIGPERRAVMTRVQGPKTALLARGRDKPAGVGFVAIHDGVAMVHALEVPASRRRQGSARNMMRYAAHWAQARGAGHLAVLCRQDNDAANGLYLSLGMTLAGQYHYRIKEEETTT